MADELHYVSYDPAAIWDGMIQAYIAQGGDVLYGGDEKEMLLRAVQEIVVLTLAQVDNALRMTTLRYAQGEYLKLLGEERGCAYMDAVSARGMLEITFRAGYPANVLPAGTTFTPDGARFYATDADMEYSGEGILRTVGITCTEPGVKGNGVAAGTLMTPVKSAAMVETARAVMLTSGGGDGEDMESYRERVRQAQFLTITTGPAEQYRAHALAVSSEIYDAVVLRGESAGVVEIYLALSDGAAAQGVIDEVTQALSADDIRPLTDSVHVQEADELTYSMDIEYVLPENGSVTAQDMEAAADEYRAWQERVIGRAFDPYQLISNLYRAGALRVTIKDTSQVGGAAPAYTPVDAHTRARGAVTLAEAEAAT